MSNTKKEESESMFIKKVKANHRNEENEQGIWTLMLPSWPILPFHWIRIHTIWNKNADVKN